jgi:Ca2+-binding RTX toxin-like protein
MTYALEGPKWGSSVRGTSASITWSFADQNLTSSLAPSYSGYPSLTGSIGADFRDVVRSAFSLWSAVTGVSFVESSDQATNNLRVGEAYIDGNGSTLATTTYWYNGQTFLKAVVDFDTDAFANTQQLFAVSLHEIGHAIGLDHSSSPQDLMYPYLGPQNQNGLSIDDMTGARALYTSGLTLQGTSSNDLLNGDSGDDLIFGKEGADTIDAGGGNNIVVGGVDSADGADLIRAGSGNDLIYGNGGDDTISSSGGNDIVVGGYGNDSIVLGAGSDIVYGNQGNDFINAGDGNNLVIGGFGDDYLVTGAGNDIIYGNEGNDTLSGGNGADRYVFYPGDGNDLILGFSSIQGDALDLQGQTYSVSQDAQNFAVLNLSGGGTVTLAGYTEIR